MRVIGALRAAADDGPGDRPGALLLAVAEEDVGELRLAQLVDQIGRAGAFAAHAHVERSVAAEGEAALGLVELHGGDAEIERNPVGRRHALGGQEIDHLAEAALDQGQPAGEAVGKGRALGDRPGIAVEPDHAAIGGFQYGAAIAAGPEGPVDIDAAVAGCQQLQHLGQQHGAVTGGAHAPSPAGRRGKVRPFSRARRRASDL